ncbi:hypothetical protein NW752_003327 [Fusarium irregulare]|uniref:GH16 domain-containing protein n=1 Tax=Fusarium irregulare TaxID=2494466 RepID=A0A9W8PT28_9HYPO|nr:hypothetical protein NW766_004395 [Fusarium irregulare]KAJ4022872.1 hypothetical protein NW752_003327 [Fusarium irregulare]
MTSLRKFTLLAIIAITHAQSNDASHPETEPEDWEADQCDCFLTDGLEPEYYTAHRFWDFRNLAEYAGIPDTIAGENDTADADVTSKYFKKKEWKNFWKVQSWSNRRSHDTLAYGARFPMVNSANNIYIRTDPDKNPDSETYLTMRTNRQEDFQVASEFDSIDRFQFLSIRFRGRIRGAAGACMAMFTYVPAEEIKNVQEADLEILTREGTDRIHYTNHPGYSIRGELYPEATRNTSLPDTIKWNDWVEHRLDWTPNQSIWYANGQKVANISFQVPRDPSLMIFNAWGDGGVWTTNMTTGEEAYMEMQWLQMLYNVSDGSASKHKREVQDAGPRGRFLREKRDGQENVCKMVCSIDEEPGAGVVTWMWGNNSAASMFAGHSAGGGLYSLISWVLGLILLVQWI